MLVGGGVASLLLAGLLGVLLFLSAADRGRMRETRVGLTASYRMLHRLRLGAGAEWTRRDDRYDTDEVSGAPDQGSHHLDFSGDAIGGTLGFRFDSADSGAGTWTVGGALRYLPKLDLKGRLKSDLLSGTVDSAFSATRESGIEGGLAVGFAQA